MTPGPSPAARTAAVAAGWVPPLAWDDIDDPAESPADDQYSGSEHRDDVVVAAALAGRLRWDTMTIIDQEVLVEDLHGRRTLAETAELVDTTRRAVERTWDRVLARRLRAENPTTASHSTDQQTA